MLLREGTIRGLSGGRLEVAREPARGGERRLGRCFDALKGSGIIARQYGSQRRVNQDDSVKIMRQLIVALQADNGPSRERRHGSIEGEGLLRHDTSLGFGVGSARNRARAPGAWLAAAEVRPVSSASMGGLSQIRTPPLGVAAPRGIALARPCSARGCRPARFGLEHCEAPAGRLIMPRPHGFGVLCSQRSGSFVPCRALARLWLGASLPWRSPSPGTASPGRRLG